MVKSTRVLKVAHINKNIDLYNIGLCSSVGLFLFTSAIMTMSALKEIEPLS